MTIKCACRCKSPEMKLYMYIVCKTPNCFIFYKQDTGEILMPQDLKKAQTYGGRKICFEKDEVASIKRFEDSGNYFTCIFTCNICFKSLINWHHYVIYDACLVL